MSDQETRRRAHDAGVELRAYGEATQDVRQQMVQRWLDTKVTETELREHIWRSIKALDSVHAALQAAVSGGAFLDSKQAVKQIMEQGETNV